MPLRSGEIFAGFRVVSQLGAGGMGEVYLAQHPRLPRKYALKVLPAAISADSEYHERFIREADMAARLSHPNIVGVHDRGECDGQLWIAIDYVNGPDAGRLLSERFPAGMSVDDVLEIVTAAGEALDYAHDQGLLHRDVKPANLLLESWDGRARRVLLADFGIARNVGEISGLTATNMTLGTVAYAAPEQLMGAPTSMRSRPALTSSCPGCSSFLIQTPLLSSVGISLRRPRGSPMRSRDWVPWTRSWLRPWPRILTIGLPGALISPARWPPRGRVRRVRVRRPLPPQLPGLGRRGLRRR